MTDLPDNDTSWLSNPAPPPRSMDPVMTRPAAQPDEKPARKAPARPKPALRPVEQLADDIEGAPEADAGDPPPDPSRPDPARTADQPKPRPRSDRGQDDGSPPPRDRGRPKGQIWDGCPVKPLGVNGSTSYFLDVLGQMRGVGKLERMTIMHLFGHRYGSLCDAFPQWTTPRDDEPPKKKAGKFEGDAAAAAMTMAASEKGLFDPESAVRGVGAWADDDGQLVYHMGDEVLIGGKAHEPGTHQGKIYPAFPAIPHPAPAGEDHDDPVPHILAVLETWNWRRKSLDAYLSLGMIGCLILGGAFSWRPAFWLTGGAGAGKSSFQLLLQLLLGGEKGLIQSPDSTARGIAALLGQSTLPVGLDEMEPDENSQKNKAIIDTARVAASGGRWVRGSSDQKGSSGQLRSTFLFSSIIVPGVLQSEDLQRIIKLLLDPLPEGSKPPDLTPALWRKRGAVLKRQMIDRWHDWAERLRRWRAALEGVKITGRPADNWGTVLAMADMMSRAALPTPELCSQWVSQCAPFIETEKREAGNDATEFLTHLMSREFDVFRRGEKFTVAQWLQVAAGSPGAPPGLLGDFGHDPDDRRRRSEAANRALAKANLKIVANGKDEPFLFIGYEKVQALLELFSGSRWAGGAWRQSAERVQGAFVTDLTRTLAGVRSRGTNIPVSSLPGLMDAPEATMSTRTPPPPAKTPDDMEDFA